MDKPVQVKNLQARGDLELREKLLAMPEIKRAMEHFAAEDKELGARRQLLATSMWLTPEMAPDIHAMMADASRRLSLDTPIETYVYPAPVFNAAAVRPEGGRLFIMLSSSLLEAFSADELKFVIGHELGHHVFDHHHIPVAALLSGRIPISAGVALQLFAWQRYAEISCDRVGLVCAGNLEAAASALFKMASGIRGDRIKVNIDQFIAQAHELKSEVDRMAKAEEVPRQDWFSTHPFSPLRIVSIELFSESDVMIKDGISQDTLEDQVHSLMGVMSPSYLSEKSEIAEMMRRLLFAGAVYVASKNREIPEEAVKALEELLGPGTVPSELNVEKIIDDLPSRIEAVNKKVPKVRRTQIIRDFCVVARANGRLDEAEMAAIVEIAKKIDVDPALVACLGQGTLGKNTPPSHFFVNRAQ